MANPIYRGGLRWLILLALGLISLNRVGAQIPPAIPASYTFAAENSTLALYVDHATLAFKVLDKRSGYVWHSGIDEPLEGDKLNRTWRAFAQSGVSIEYLDAKAVDKRISITNSEHTLTITPLTQGIAALLSFTEYGLTLEVRLELAPDSLRVSVPFASIREDNPAFRLGQVHLYPFMGAARGSSVEGYMLLPDGTGSLIRFADTTKAKNMFYGRYYGDDLGILGAMPYDPRVKAAYPLSLPVFGLVQGVGQNAFLSVVEQGSAYAEVQVHPAGIITNYNFLYNAFIYNQAYYQATNRSGAGVTVLQKQTNPFDVVQQYRFVTGDQANYVGLAHSYQAYLLEKSLLHRHAPSNPNMPLRIEFLGGDKEKVLFWERFVPMTTLPQMQAILADLALANLDVTLYGWQPLGAGALPPTTFALEGGLGNRADLQALIAQVTADGGRFSLYYNPQGGQYAEAGYSKRNEVALAITKVPLEGLNNRHYTHYFSQQAVADRFTRLSQSVSQTLPSSLALDSIGYTLYSDYRDGAVLDRQAAMQAYQTLLAQAPQGLGLYHPNDYLLGVAEAYYEMPLSSNGYIYTAEAVPFLPIVLAGQIPYYGYPLNFSSNLRGDLLRQVEYGIYPAYFLTQEATATMLNTASAWIYSSSYEQWGGQIRQTYAWMNALLLPVRGQSITGHRQVAAGVFATTYANGRQVIVNYNEQSFTQGGVTVPPLDALVVEQPL